MATCRADGVLLKPDYPSTILDLVFSNSFVRSGGPILDYISHSYSAHEISFFKNGRRQPHFRGNSGSKVTWHYLLSVNLDTMYTVYPSDLYDNKAANYFVFNYVQGAAKSLGDFNNDTPFSLPKLPHKGTDANYL